LAGVQITEGYPLQPDVDFIAILDADPHEQDPAGQRPSPKAAEETFTLIVEISAVRIGDTDAAEVIDRAYVLAAELENELRTDMTIGGSLPNGWALIEGLPLNTVGPSGEGRREAIIRARVRCRARI
jgi:hypothetical protein